MASKKKSPPPGPEMARKIWLAGIGAYGRAFSEAQESLARVSDETSKMFEDLVERGEEIEEKVESHGRELASRVKAPRMSVEDRINEMREKLQFNASGDSRMDDIEARLVSIEKKLDQLLAAKPARRGESSKSTTRSKKPAV